MRCLVLLLALWALVLTSGCGREQARAAVPSSTASLESDVEELRALKTIPHVLAEGIEGPNGRPFYITERMDPAACATCHQALPERPETSGEIRQRHMHLDIELNHGAQAGLDCNSCHGSSPGELISLKGAEVAQVHQLCGQCHFEQVRDWAGGAHGKRLAGWRGKRVINNCVACHNPHDPAFKARFPEPGPLLPTAPVYGAHHD